MIPAEAAYETIVSLGDVGLVQFVDLNSHTSAFQRTYATEVKRCDEMTRILRFFKEQVEKEDLPSSSTNFDDESSLDELEARLEELERDLLEVNANSERLQRTHSEFAELQLVLQRAGRFFEEAQGAARPAEVLEMATFSHETTSTPLLESGPRVEPSVARLGFIAGLIAKDKLEGFENLLFRATRGNVFLKHTGIGTVTEDGLAYKPFIKDPTTGELQEKVVFVAFFSGESLKNKIIKICEVYGANRYPFPEDPDRQRQMNSDVKMRLTELSRTIEAGEKLRLQVLAKIATNLNRWCTRLMREKAAYHAMNKLDVGSTRKVLVGEVWIPVTGLEDVQEALSRASESSCAQTGTILEPMRSEGTTPTYFKTNKFTEGFQAIVDAYGIARYREVNPTVFTIITFPFLFAIMFGDLGHGILMLLFALFMVLCERALGRSALNDILEMLFGGRYLILLMSIFSIYTGLMYNEAFSMPMTIFGDTKWKCLDESGSVRVASGDESLNGKIDNRICHDIPLNWASDEPYPFGLDPIWHGTKTELTFTNSVKMKMSIILGVIHMNLGIIMSVFNHRYFQDSLSIWFEFLPQLLFLNSLFGYLCFLIIYKWTIDFREDDRGRADLYSVMIDMFLSPGAVEDDGRLYDGQASMQVFLLLIAFASIPLMLLPKPLILRKRHQSGHMELMNDDDDEPSAIPTHDDSTRFQGGVFDFGEVMVHQIIHTIEYVLGTISNTASYLRLWALTLAHSQLSAVFYDRVLMLVVEMASDPKDGGTSGLNVIFIVIGYFVFAMATIGVLMIMESLSAFLHALRLHWVEFQNKFYMGDGHKFVAFSFAALEKDEL